MSDRVEHNIRLAHAASPNVSLPPSKAYRENYDAIFKKRKAPSKKKSSAKPKPKQFTTKQLGKLGFAMYGIK